MNAIAKSGAARALYDEVWKLSRSIIEARRQIATLRPKKLQTKNLSEAFLEMQEIVRQTEQASDAIMDAAEKISAADTSDPGYQAHVQEQCSRIFESCTFQDLTGQRISKVMGTLELVDSHLESLQQLLGPDFEESEDTDETPEGDAALLNGPALEGQGISQDDIDKLFE